jgi:UDP-glucose 4-epimerase
VRRVVVTGGAGFIGSHLVDALLEGGDKVLVVDDLSAGSRRHLDPRAEFLEADIRDDCVADLIVEWGPQAIAHHAAQISVGHSVRNPICDVEVNVLGSVRMLDAACRAGAFFLFASTGGAMYGDGNLLPTPETQRPWPVSPYGVSKLAVEHYLHAYKLAYGLRYAALRYANVYGPRQNPHGEAGVIAIFCEKLANGRPAVINGDGRQTRDFIHVSDVVAAAQRVLQRRVCGTFNVGTGRQTDVRTIHALIASALGVPDCPHYTPAKAGEQLASALDSRLLSSLIGWRPLVGLEQGIGESARSFLDTERLVLS